MQLRRHVRKNCNVDRPSSHPRDLRSIAVALDDATVVVHGWLMINPKDPTTCKACALTRALIAKLDERLTALETEVRGAPVDVLLEEFDTAKTRRDARQAAVDEYHRLQEEEFYRDLPQLKAAAAERRLRYEAFMRERGFEP